MRKGELVMKTKLAPLADQIAASYRVRNEDLTDDRIWEEILEDVRCEEPGMDYFAMDMVVGMVARRLGIQREGN
jgi:hypothetical protein